MTRQEELHCAQEQQLLIDAAIQEAYAHLHRLEALREENRALILSIRSDLEGEACIPTAPQYETLYSLIDVQKECQGKKPAAIIFPDGEREEVSSWKQLFTAVMVRCNQNPDCHRALMDLRGMLRGRSRILLGSEPGRMSAPIQIDEALYAEAHYDSRRLLQILTRDILPAVRYDFTGIRAAILNPPRQ